MMFDIFDVFDALDDVECVFVWALFSVMAMPPSSKIRRSSCT